MKKSKSNLFRNIAWIIIFFSITFTIISGVGALGQYRIYKNPYISHNFINNMAEVDSILYKSLYALDSEGKIDEKYLESEFQNRKTYRKEEYDWEIRELESSSIQADSSEEYEKIKEQKKNNITKRYENDLKNLEREVKLNTEQIANNFKNILNISVNLQFFIKNVDTGKTLTNMSTKIVEEAAVSREKVDDYEFFIQSGLNSRIYPYRSENANLAYEYNMNSSNAGIIKIYKADKNIVDYPNDYIYQAKSQSDNALGIIKNIAISCAILMGLAIVSTIYLCKTRSIYNNDFAILNKIYRKIPIEISVIGIVAGAIITIRAIQSSIYYYSYGATNNILLISSTWYEIIMYSSIVAIVSVLIYLFIKNTKETKDYNYIKSHSLIYKLGTWIKNLYLSIKGRKFVVLNFIISIIWIGIAVVLLYQGYYNYPFIIAGNAMIVIYVIVVMVYWFKIDKCMTNIYKASSRIRQGDFNQTIKEEGSATLRLTAENLNNIKDGLEKAISSATRNEQLKTELITNVSHDLKTPLTSIINYIDLLKDENATEEEKRKYIDIITKKSARLKVLIEDLFEASKAASKTMELNMEKADIVSLVRQTLGEFEEKISRSNLKFVVKLPEEKAYVNIDGKRTWRVLENLLSNVLKYSMDNTRVYVEVIPTEEDVKIVMRNISAFEMDFTEEDILERFRRGDSSRHTEGSGLGLSIAKSLTELQDGTLKIDIDGDLFKVTVTFKKYIGSMKAE